MFFLNPKLRKVLICFLDLILLTLGFYGSIYLSDLHTMFFIKHDLTLIISLYTIIGTLVFILTGQYNSLTRYLQSRFLYSILLRNLLILFLSNTLYFFLSGLTISLRVLILNYLIISILLTFYRILVRDILFKDKPNNFGNRKNLIIFGMNNFIPQMINDIRKENIFNVKAIVEDKKSYKGLFISGVKIINSLKFNEMLESGTIDQVLISDSRFDVKKLNYLFKKIKTISTKTKIFQVPELKDLENFVFTQSAIRPIRTEDLLCREAIPPLEKFLNKSVKDQTVLVTGAGGSIGSELSRQIIRLSPKKLILLDNSENSLFNISNEINAINPKNNDCSINTILGNAKNKKFIDKLFELNNIDIVYHAAAYKHVALVEKNPISGLSNNIYDTLILAKSALKNKIKKFVFISSDKAVRPTNIMGLSKRIAELIIQSLSKKNANSLTKFSIVRFGNVLRSSGSVVPLFEKQIKEGGPITLTDKRVVRYFMTIEEAVQLVLQASSLSLGGEVFLLDMGKPVKIYDLALLMIKLSGKTLKNKNNTNGDIEIVITGLKEGEKLYEELLIDAESKKSEHPLIYFAKEKNYEGDDFWEIIEDLCKSFDNNNLEKALKITKKLVPEWQVSNFFKKYV